MIKRTKNVKKNKKKRKKKKSITIASRKSKARKLQKWTAEEISKVTGFDWGKDCPIEPRPMGQSGVDIRLEKSVLEVFPYSVECKAQENWSVHQWVKQARINKMDGTDWLIVARRSRRKEVVIMDAEAFFKLFKGEI